MSLLEAIILGLIQGLTEFLPVSSSGHLVLGQALFGLDEPGVTLEVMLHLGTLLSVLWVFRSDFVRLLTFYRDPIERRFLIFLILGAIPTALIGLYFKSYADLMFQSTLLVGIMLLVTGAILRALIILPPGLKSIKEMNHKDALLVGLIQGLAIIPGISRSGSTITAALWRGLDRDTAIRYSFMLSAPVIFGASLLEVKDMISYGIESDLLLHYIAGGLIAFLAGVAAIKAFIHLLKEQKFHYFSIYCWAAGLTAIIFSVL